MGAAAVLWATTASAQNKPNFSGKWQLDAEKTAAANPQGAGGGGGRGGGRGGGGMGPMSITQSAADLTIERETPQGAMTTAYKLDGSTQTVTMGQGEAQVKAMWEGATLVIETTRQMGGNTVTTKAVYAMEGEYLVVATTSPPRGGGEPVTRKQYYKKGA
jgi:hypothetical protein